MKRKLTNTSYFLSERTVFIVLAFFFLLGGIGIAMGVSTTLKIYGQQTSLVVHACINKEGGIRILSDSQICKADEKPLDWNVQGPPGPTGLPGQVQRFESIGTGLNPITPAATWIDVPNAAITQNFDGGQWKGTYTGLIAMSGGNATAHVRIQIRPASGQPSDFGTITMYRFQSPLPSTESSTQMFTVQGLFRLQAGTYTIVPQVYSNDPTWILSNSSILILEK